MPDCQKLRFGSRREARRYVRQKPFLTRVYQCHVCLLWHTTSADGETTRMLREYRQRMVDWRGQR